MLKFLEEPEDNILGFFITSNKERVIDTIKSRCQIMKIDYATKSKVDEKIVEYANEYVSRILNNCDLIVNKEFILPDVLWILSLLQARIETFLHMATREH